MKTSQAGIELVQSFESCELNAYVCPAGVVTIGWGHTGKNVAAGQCITQARADELLAEDLGRFEREVERLVKVPLAQHQFDALVSFSFNVGAAALAGSTLLKKLNAGDYRGAADEFPKWNRGGGKVLAGLTRRRAAERQMFLG